MAAPRAIEADLRVTDVLQVTLVNAQGKHVTINEHTDPDYFWAIRGGGGSAWGVRAGCDWFDASADEKQVITSVTYRTHPEPSHIQIAAIQLNATANSTLRTVWERSISALVNMTDAGYTGYGYLSDGFAALFVRPNGTDDELLRGSAAFRELGQLDGTSFVMFNLTFPRWIDYCDAILQDPNIALNVMDSSRLLTTDMALHKADKIVDMMMEYGPEYYPGFNFSKHSSRLSEVPHWVWI
jgi:hypothetical protein